MMLAVSLVGADLEISEATARNWSRLRSNRQNRLTSRANKRLSRKTLIPAEYFYKSENVRFAQNVADVASARGYAVRAVLRTLAIMVLRHEGLLHQDNVQRVLSETSDWGEVDLADCGMFDVDEPDLLGGVYQSLLYEGVRNKEGIYYTRLDVAKALVTPCMSGKDRTILDPCCGSGAILCAAQGFSPENIYGIDRDPIAVFLAKLNLIRRYRDVEFIPHIHCLDFLSAGDEDLVQAMGVVRFDNICTNPPWGATTPREEIVYKGITSGEVFSLFYARSCSLLAQKGVISFLLPNAVLNVAAHRDLRSFILSHGQLKGVLHFDRLFSGVTTKYVRIVTENIPAREDVPVEYESDGRGRVGTMPRSTIVARGDLSFQFVDNADASLLARIRAAGPFTLAGSLWALGVVTGDNKGSLKDEPDEGLEPIYTGREVLRYRLSSPRKFLRFDRNSVQQAAKDELYRAEEKLVYRFIFDRPQFSYDTSRSLTLNSANVLIPKVPGLSVKSCAAFLNSEVLTFYYRNVCGGTKVLKTHLLSLPLPCVDDGLDRQLASLVDAAIAGDPAADERIQSLIYSAYGLMDDDVVRIREFCNGKAD